MYYLDKSTYRLLQIDMFSNGYLGTSTYYLNYTETNGVTLPFLVIMYPTRGQKQETKIEKAEINIPFEESVFNVNNKYNSAGAVIDSKELRTEYQSLAASVDSLRTSSRNKLGEIGRELQNNLCFAEASTKLKQGCYSSKNKNIYLALQISYKFFVDTSFGGYVNTISEKGYTGSSLVKDEDNEHLNSMESYVDKNTFLSEWKKDEENFATKLNEFNTQVQKISNILKSSPDEIEKYNKLLNKVTTINEVSSILKN
jgi:hypothetical protein